MFSIRRLYDLQELDWTIASYEKSLGEVQAKLADDSSLVSAREHLEYTEMQLAARASARRDAEFTVQSLEDKVTAAEKRLYGGAVTNPRELSAYEEERYLLQKKRSAEEDKLLELLVEIEDIQSAHHQASEHLSNLKAQRAVEHAALSKTAEQLTGELDKLRQSRNKMTAQIPSPILSVYESLGKSRIGHAVAKVERGMCQGCRISLPLHVLQQARLGREPVQCTSCGRLLYLS